MSEMKHTPGPWHVATKVQPNGAHLVRDNSTPPLLIAEVIDGHSDYSTEANARLIAAAPELLEALEWITEEGELTADGYEQALAVIAKAKGE